MTTTTTSPSSDAAEVSTPVRRYRLQTPEWLRLLWVSAEAKALWADVLPRVSTAFLEAERLSVGRVRPAALGRVEPGQLPEAIAAAESAGQVVTVLGRVPRIEGYQAASVALVEGQPWEFLVAWCDSPATAARLRRARAEGDTDAEGACLGYPPCCREAFRRWWVEEGWLDVTWPTALGSPGRWMGPDVRLVDGPAEANGLLRWLGLRPVPHLPCSFACEATVAFARDLRAEMDPSAAAWLMTLLDQPMEWSAWHGIGQVKTPLWTISMTTDGTDRRLVVRRPGASWPAGAKAGSVFPYQRPAGAAVPLTVLLGRQALARQPVWHLNGFQTPEAMQEAHTVLLWAYGQPPPVALPVAAERHVLDLGCGTGALLDRLPAASRWGVERDPARAALAQQAPHLRILVADLFRLPDWQAWASRQWDVVLLMPGRLLEAPAEAADRLRAWLRTAARALLVYAYGDWLAREWPSGRGLAALAEAAGLRIVSPIVSAPSGIAAAAWGVVADPRA